VPDPLAGARRRQGHEAFEGPPREAVLPATHERQGGPSDREEDGGRARGQVTVPRWRRLQRGEAALTGDRATVAGVDEAGRGPLAGPVVAAAVVLEPGTRWTGLDDSKVLDAEEREELYARVLERTRAFRWAVVGPRAIDRMNIRRASLEAM